MDVENEFKREEAAMAKTLFLQFLCLVCVGDDRKCPWAEVEGRSGEVKQVFEWFVSEKDFELDAVCDWQPVQFLEHRGYLDSGTGVWEGTVLDEWKFAENFGWW